MLSHLRYRLSSVLGSAALVAVGVVVANHPVVQEVVLLSLPLLRRIPLTTLSNGELAVALLVTLAVTLAALSPLFKPRPRRLLDTAMMAQRRVVLAGIALAAIGYFDYTYRLPRATLVLTVAFAVVTVPVWLVYIRERPIYGERTIVVGNSRERMEDAMEAVDEGLVGYIAPRSMESAPRTDGGVVQTARPGFGDGEWLGTFARLDDVLIDHAVDTAVLAFTDEDRGDFFGVLDTCYEHGVDARAHPAHADFVLAAPDPDDDLIPVELEPWDLQDYVAKRLFDVAFAGVGLLVAAPLVAAIAAAIKLDSPGPVLYGQQRTSAFGDTFTVYKFRSMVPDAESGTGAVLSEEDAGGVDPRVTRVGRLLRRTHLDEIPQLRSVLVGDMSVVGPRPERPELETEIEADADVVEWRKRWFVKPGLTGLAQINDVTGTEPERKLRYDLQYIRDQSFWLDVKIVIRQVWKVVIDAVAVFRGAH